MSRRYSGKIEAACVMVFLAEISALHLPGPRSSQPTGLVDRSPNLPFQHTPVTHHGPSSSVSTPTFSAPSPRSLIGYSSFCSCFRSSLDMCYSISENKSPSLVARKCLCLALMMEVAVVGVRVAGGQGLGDLQPCSWAVWGRWGSCRGPGMQAGSWKLR